MDQKAYKQLGLKIYEVIKGEDPEIIPDALVSQITFQMSLVCPDCRKNIARKLKRAIPRMLAHATRTAVTYENPSASCH
jgi:hypothetical protein